MLQFKSGNLLEADAEALVNTVNCVGVMGKGIALQFKRAFPENMRAYERACKTKQLVPGRLLVFETGAIANPKFIVNFPTKLHWKEKSKIEFIQTGLTALVNEVIRLQLRSIAIPPLGCGNGGLDWSAVYPLIEEAFRDLPNVMVQVFPPSGAPIAEYMPVASARPKLTRARALFIKLIQRYRHPGYRLSLVEVQKLAYFLQEASEPLKLNFVKHHFGPYAENLNFVLQRLEGHYTQGYGDRSGRAEIGLLPDAAAQADECLANHPDAVERLEQVSRWIQGFESPYGLELLATVHWVANHELPPGADEESVIASVHSWNSRKQSFSAEHIRLANRRFKQGMQTS